LMVLESMKMEIPVQAPVAGQVVKLNTAEGEAVTEGDSLLTISESPK